MTCFLLVVYVDHLLIFVETSEKQSIILGDGHEKLETCMSSGEVFIRLHQQGKHSSIKQYWFALGKDVPALCRVYLDAGESDTENGEHWCLLYDVLGKNIAHIRIPT